MTDNYDKIDLENFSNSSSNHPNNIQSNTQGMETTQNRANRTYIAISAALEACIKKDNISSEYSEYLNDFEEK